MLNKPGDITKFEDSQVAMLETMFNSIFNHAAGIQYTDQLPTLSSTSEREVIVYDDGAGIKRLYFVTGKGNLGYVNLT